MSALKTALRAVIKETKTAEKMAERIRMQMPSVEASVHSGNVTVRLAPARWVHVHPDTSLEAAKRRIARYRRRWGLE